MRGYEPWPTVRRTVPIETARELARRADDARVETERAVRQAESWRREAGELKREVEALRREAERARTDREALLAARAELTETRAELDAALDALQQRAAAPAAAPVAPAAPADARVEAVLADLANVRRQRDAEIERVREEERGRGLVRLAEVVDDLERAIALHDDPASPWVEGTVALLGRVRRQLEQSGGVLFGRFGDPFDPELHEAIGLGHGVPDTVVGVQRSGLRLVDGSLVRPAQVVVGTASPNPEAQR